jgi:hypothetical protein
MNLNFINNMTEEELSDFIKKYNLNKDDFCHLITNSNREFSESFFKKHKKMIPKEDIFRFGVSEELLRNLIKKIGVNKANWIDIVKYQKLSVSFLKEFKDKIDWFCVKNENNATILTDQICEELDEELCEGNEDCVDKIDPYYHYEEKNWTVKGKYHRTLGPARIFYDIRRKPQYWYRGKYLKNIKTDEELKRWLRLRIFDNESED